MDVNEMKPMVPIWLDSRLIWNLFLLASSPNSSNTISSFFLLVIHIHSCTYIYPFQHFIQWFDTDLSQEKSRIGLGEVRTWFLQTCTYSELLYLFWCMQHSLNHLYKMINLLHFLGKSNENIIFLFIFSDIVLLLFWLVLWFSFCYELSHLLQYFVFISILYLLLIF